MPTSFCVHPIHTQPLLRTSVGHKSITPWFHAFAHLLCLARSSVLIGVNGDLKLGQKDYTYFNACKVCSIPFFVISSDTDVLRQNSLQSQLVSLSQQYLKVFKTSSTSEGVSPHVLGQLSLCEGAMVVVAFCIMTARSFLQSPFVVLHAALSMTISVLGRSLKNWNPRLRWSGKITPDGCPRDGGVIKMMVSLLSRVQKSWRDSWLMIVSLLYLQIVLVLMLYCRYMRHHMTLLHNPDHQVLTTDPTFTIMTPEGKQITVLPFRLGPPHSQPCREVQAPIECPIPIQTPMPSMLPGTPISTQSQNRKMQPLTISSVLIPWSGSMRPPALLLCLTFRLMSLNPSQRLQ